MAGRFKASKFKNLLAQEWKKEQWYHDIRPYTGPNEATNICCSGSYLIVNWASTGAPSLAMIPISSVGKRQEPKMLHGHSSPLCDMAFSPFEDTLLGSSSEDATVKLWRLPQCSQLNSSEPTLLQTLQGHKRKVDSIAFHPCSAAVIASVSSDKTVKVWDMEKGTAQLSSSEQADALWSVSWDFAGALLAVTSKDKKIKIFDPRSNAAAPTMECACHDGPKATRVTWMGRHNMLLTTGFDRQQSRQIGIFDPRNFTKALKMRPLDSSSGVCTPLYDGDTDLLYLCGKGDSVVKVFEASETEPFVTETTHGTSDVQSKGVCLLPKTRCNVMACEVDVVFKLGANAVVPTGMYVPRKHSMFQPELFPDTPAAVQSMTSAEWFAGENKPIALVSLKPDVPEQEEAVPVEAPRPMAAQPKSATPKLSPSPTVSPASPQARSPSPQAARSQSPSTSPAPAATAQPTTKKLNIVRYSKFRNIGGASFMKSTWQEDVHANTNVPDALIHANGTYFAAPWQGPGGRLVVWPIEKPGRFPTDIHWFEHGSDLVEFAMYPFNDRLVFTGGEDAHIKMWEIPEDGVLRSVVKNPVSDLSGHSRRVTMISFHPSAANVMISSAMDFSMKLWDVEKCEVCREFDQHKDQVNNVSWDWKGALMASSCKDSIIRLWDPRSSTLAREGVAHEGAKGFQVQWAGKRDTTLVTVGFSKSSERQWAVWDSRDLSKPLGRSNIDQGATMLTAHYDPDLNILMTAARGESTFKFFEIVEEAPYCHFLTEFTTSTPSAGFEVLPKRNCNVKNCEIFQVIRLSGMPPATVERVSFTVPRTRMEFFQDDIFPPTRSQEPAIKSASEWFGGATKEPLIVSLQPAGLTPLSQAPQEEKAGPKYRLLTEEERREQREVTREDVLNGFFGRTQDYKEEETRETLEEKRKKEEADGWAVKEDEWD
eukprot:TRINITY_DN16925_c0_g1_i1.p1 TRINITY_DN16925_c0_g1~~TRINITY_DN16925_c0_g1_i1.p1  ORF type:complete len:936 (-),score=216.98 TRINITY_DN16925_c0_g1_i1:53-2860(-)